MSGYYHLSVEVIGRGKGRSAVACAAYRAGARMHDQRYGKTHDYTPRSGIRACGIVVPEHAPSWASERETLWNELEAFEKRKDAQLAREFVLGLPHQLDPAHQIEIVESFIRDQLTPLGLVADWAIHEANRRGDMRNAHAHVMVTIRGLTACGFLEKKDRSQNTPEQLNAWRSAWAEIQNEAFRSLDLRGVDGQIVQVDHRSYLGQGLELEPTHHMGVHATAMERRGELTEIGEINRAILKSNADRRARRSTRRNRAAAEDLKRRIAERLHGKDLEI